MNVLGAVAVGAIAVATFALAVAAVIADRSLDEAQRLWALAGIAVLVLIVIVGGLAIANETAGSDKGETT